MQVGYLKICSHDSLIDQRNSEEHELRACLPLNEKSFSVLNINYSFAQQWKTSGSWLKGFGFRHICHLFLS